MGLHLTPADGSRHSVMDMGRPKKKEEEKADTVPVTLRFPRELHQRLSEIAAREERTFLTTVLRAIRAGLESEQKAAR